MSYRVCDDIRRYPNRSLKGETLGILKKIGPICISGASYGGEDEWGNLGIPPSQLRAWRVQVSQYIDIFRGP